MGNNEDSKPTMLHTFRSRVMFALGIGGLLVVAALAHKQPFFWMNFFLTLVAILLLLGAARGINRSKTSQGAEKSDGDGDGDVGNPK